MDPRIADYIRANRRTYTREAITKQLLDAGHDPGEIERTWAALDTRDPDAVAGEGFWGRFALILIGINLGVLVLVGFLTGALQNAAQGGLFLLIILAVVLALGALIAWAIVSATGPAKLNPTTALVIGIVIPLLFALLIGGACYALIGGLGGGFSSPPQGLPGTMTVDLSGAFELDARLEAECLLFGTTPVDGFGINAVTRDAEGREVVIEVSAHAPGPGGSFETFVSIALDPGSMDTGEFWSSEAPTSGIRDAEVDFAQGRIGFSELQGFSNETGEALDPLDGEVAWSCGQ